MSGRRDGANTYRGKAAASPADRKVREKNTGRHDFSGQEERDNNPETDTQEKEAREAHGMEHGGHGVRFERQHNEHNGAGRSKRVISAGAPELHGGRVNQREGGDP